MRTIMRRYKTFNVATIHDAEWLELCYLGDAELPFGKKKKLLFDFKRFIKDFYFSGYKGALVHTENPTLKRILERIGFDTYDKDSLVLYFPIGAPCK